MDRRAAVEKSMNDARTTIDKAHAVQYHYQAPTGRILCGTRGSNRIVTKNADEVTCARCLGHRRFPGNREGR